MLNVRCHLESWGVRVRYVLLQWAREHKCQTLPDLSVASATAMALLAAFSCDGVCSGGGGGMMAVAVALCLWVFCFSCGWLSECPNAFLFACSCVSTKLCV